MKKNASPPKNSKTTTWESGADRYFLPLFLLALTDFCVFAAALWIAYPIRFFSPVSEWFPLREGWDVPSFEPFFKFGLLAGVVGVLTFERLGFYRQRIGLDRAVHLFRILFGVFTANLLLQVVLSVAGASLSLGTRLIAAVQTVPLAVAAHYFLKQAHQTMMSRGGVYRRTLLVCDRKENVEDKLHELQEERGSEFLVGSVLLASPLPAREVEQAAGKRPPIAGDLRDLRRLLASGRFDSVVILLTPDNVESALRVIRLCDLFGVEFFMTSDLFEQVLKKISAGTGWPIPVLALGETPLTGSAVVLKRLFDLVGSACLILLCLPFWGVLALLIKLDSKGPVLYAQERVGHDGRTFKVLKFRSMKVGAEAETGPVWAVKDDPRRTRLGAWMRKYNIDETPQFLNVFRGEMSLVGPRPERPHFVDNFKENIPSYIKRHIVKSGMTGWAQVNGLRGDTSIEERTRYDMWYIRNWSLWLDIKILFRTLFTCGS